MATTIDKRIDAWISFKKDLLGGREEDIRTFLYNFTACNPRLDGEAIQQLLFDLRVQENSSLEFWSDEDKMHILTGISYAYGWDSFLDYFHCKN